jgi:hypothetical protein
MIGGVARDDVSPTEGVLQRRLQEGSCDPSKRQWPGSTCGCKQITSITSTGIASHEADARSVAKVHMHLVRRRH